jgi:Flp pilus assembly protein TadD
MPATLADAMTMHQAGLLGPAARLYQEVLVQEKDNADALHLLGVVHHQQGEHARAVQEIGRAIALQGHGTVELLPTFTGDRSKIINQGGTLK